MTSVRYLLVAAALVSIGCGRAFEATSVTGESVTSAPGAQGGIDVRSAMDKAQGASLKAQGAIADAQAAISSISDASGNIAMSFFGSIWSSITGANTPVAIDTSGIGLSVTSTGLLSPLVNRLATVFNTVFVKINEVDANFTQARLLLATAAAQLDKNDPAQAVLLAQINRQMAAIDLMENTFKAQMATLAGRIDVAKTQLSTLVTYGTSLIPVPGLNIVAGMLVNGFLLGDINNLLDAVKLKLLSV